MNAAIDIDEAPAERRCSNCLNRVLQTRLDGEEDDFCSPRCSDDWIAWWASARDVQS